MNAATALEWQRDATGPGGFVGGDNQAAQSHSLRWLPVSEPDDGLHAMVTEYWYAELVDAPDDERDGMYGVTCMTEFMVCTDPDDPGGSEVSCDYDYYEEALLHSRLEDADRQAKVRADGIRDSRYSFVWDGRTTT
jgi:hypothetical protein